MTIEILLIGALMAVLAALALVAIMAIWTVVVTDVFMAWWERRRSIMSLL